MLHDLRRTALACLAIVTLAAGQTDEPLPFPDMAPTVGAMLAENYYDAARFRPKLMVERALRSLEQAEISIDTAWADGRISLNMRGERATIDAPEMSNEAKDLPAAMRVIEQVRTAIEGMDLPAKRRRDLAYILVNGALSVLDPHTFIMPPENGFVDDIKGEFFGIGAFLGTEQGAIAIQRVMPGLPAERAGVEDGDAILAVDGEKTAGLSLDQAVRRIKGPKGTTVTLTLARKGRQAPFDLPIVRDLVKVITIRTWREHKALPEGGEALGEIGYIRMDEFNANTAHDLYQALNELGLTLRDRNKDPPVSALVLDLRQNGGGLLDQARLIGGFFLGKGEEIVRTMTSDGKQDITANSARRVTGVPVVILTSPGTASAAEIVSGALQVNGRALIAGSTTYGKGTVQNVRDLRDGSKLKLTIQEYLLPGGVSIQEVGVVPDLLLHRHAVREDGTVNLAGIADEREGDREFAIPNKNAYHHKSSAEMGWLEPYEDKESRRRFSISAREFRPDREAQLMIDILQQAARSPGFAEGAAAALEARKTRDFLIERLTQPIATRSESEAQALGAALGRLPRPIAWGSAGNAAKGSLNVTYTGKTEVTAGLTEPLTIRVDNPGEREQGRLYALVHADRFSPLWSEELVIGTAPAKGQIDGVLNYRVPPRLPDGEERFTIDLYQDGGREPVASCPVKLTVKGRPRPHLSAAWRIENGRLNPDEAGRLRIELINDGAAPAENPLVTVWKDNDPFVNLQESRKELDKPIPPGESAIITIPLEVKKTSKRGSRIETFSAESVKLWLNATETWPEKPPVDGMLRSSLLAPLVIPVDHEARGRRLIQPQISFLGAQPEAGGRTRLQFQIRDVSDDAKVQPLRFVALFLDEDKVDLQPAAALDGPQDGAWSYSPRVQLKPGVNNLRVIAYDADDLAEERHFRLWGATP